MNFTPRTPAPRPTALTGASLSLAFPLALALAFAAAPSSVQAHGNHALPPQASERARPDTPEIRVEGEIEVLVEDYAEHAETRYFLRANGRPVELHFRGRPPQLLTGTRATVRGRPFSADLEALYVESGDSVSTQSTVASSGTLPNTLGEQRTLVMLVNFQDDTSQPMSRASAHSLVFGTVGDYFRENSAGQTWLAGDTVGWYTIPVSSTSCNSGQIASEAEKRATQAGVKVSDYSRRVYMFPRNACGWAGLATVGGNPSQAWINGVFTVQNISHELGHNFGLRHAKALSCDDSTSLNCVVLTYGDPADSMGNRRAAHFGAFNKMLLGWLGTEHSPQVLAATRSERYYIDAYSAGDNAPKALRVPAGKDAGGRQQYYFVEYRRPAGFDGSLGNVGNLTSGVIVRRATEGDSDSSFFLDMTPKSSSMRTWDMEDGALVPGATFVDAANDLRLTLAWADGTTAAVDVAFGGSGPAPSCSAATPTLSLSGGAAEVLAGQGTSYTVSLKNNDSSACASATFDLTRALPSGWSGSFAASKLSVSPGATASTTLSVTTTENTASGTYTVSASATRSSGGNASASTSLKVTAPVSDTVARVGTITLSSSSRGKNVSTTAIASIVDQHGRPLTGASVTGCFSGATSGCSTATTDGVGQVSFGSGNYRGGGITFCVTAVSGSHVGSFDASNSCRSN